MDWHSRFLQQVGWTAPLRRLVFERVAPLAGYHILEVGCGTGAVLSTIPDLAGSNDIKIFGLDIDLASLHQASVYCPLALLIQGDAHRLPFPDNHFDIIFCHFLLLWLTNPLSALTEMLRAVRPGGSVIAFAEPDYGGRLDFPPELAEMGRLQEQSLRSQGADTRLGRRLKALFQKTCLVDLEIGVLGAHWQGPQSTQEIEMEWQALEHDLKTSLSIEKLARLRQIDWDAWQANERTLFIPTFYAIGRKPTSSL